MVKKIYKDNIVAGAAIRDDKGNVISKKYAKKGEGNFKMLNPEFIHPVVHKAIPFQPHIGVTYVFKGYITFKYKLQDKDNISVKLQEDYNIPPKFINTIYRINLDGYDFIPIMQVFLDSSNKLLSLTITKDVLDDNGTFDIIKAFPYIKSFSKTKFINTETTTSPNFIIYNNRYIQSKGYPILINRNEDKSSYTSHLKIRLNDYISNDTCLKYLLLAKRKRKKDNKNKRTCYVTHYAKIGFNRNLHHNNVIRLHKVNRCRYRHINTAKYIKISSDNSYSNGLLVGKYKYGLISKDYIDIYAAKRFKSNKDYYFDKVVYRKS